MQYYLLIDFKLYTIKEKGYAALLVNLQQMEIKHAKLQCYSRQ